MPKYEYMFSNYSYGFRPRRNTHQAVRKSLEYVNSGHQHIVEIDLKGFFDEVDHVLLLQILYRKIKCKATMTLLRRWLRVPIQQNGKLVKRLKGVPQGSPISPVNFQILGYGFVPSYRKGEKGKYQLVVTNKRWKTLKEKLKEVIYQ